MELDGRVRPWDDRLREAVDLGPDNLKNLLTREPPKSSHKYVLCLEYIYLHHQEEPEFKANKWSQICQKERVVVLFNTLRDLKLNPDFDSTTPERSDNGLSTKDVRRRRQRKQNNASYYDLFVASILRWQENRLQLRPFIELSCSPITKLIWESNMEALFDGGAIYACAQYGLERFLAFLLNKRIRKKLKRSVDDLVKIAFLGGPDIEMTPLGIAISNKNYECMTLLLTLENVEEFVTRGANILSDGMAQTTLLHQILKWTQSDISLQHAVERAHTVDEAAKCISKIVDLCPFLLYQHDPEGKPPYRAAYDLQHRFSSNKISETLYSAIFRHLKNNVCGARKALYSTSEPGNCHRYIKFDSSNKSAGKELGLDLSDFDHQPGHFKEYSHNLEAFNRSKLGEKWCFEETILYLNLPHLNDLDVNSMVDLLDWLVSKGVRKIIYLKLPDCKHLYHIETFIRDEILGKFEILHFNWVRLDVDVPRFAELLMETGSSSEYPIVLDIYSHSAFSGLVGLMGGDTIEGGAAPWLQRIEKICLHVVDPEQLGTDNPVLLHEHRQSAKESRNQVIQQFQEQLDDGVILEEGETLSWVRYISQQRASGVLPDNHESQMARDLEKCHRFLSMFDRLTKQSREDAELQHCWKVFQHSKVNVAVIDNGVDQMNFPLSDNIERGASFVRAGGVTEISELPWYTAAHPHGTHMAYLVRSINPWCRLFPVRVGTMQKDIDANAAIEAVKWAIAQGVDIISISWVLKKNDSDLRKVIRQAVRDHKILFYCATADTGSLCHADVYPANYDGLVTAVSASDRFGWARVESCHDVHVMLGGDKVTAKGPLYMPTAQDYISGSSAATALAAGLASLCLFLARMANDERDWNEFRDRDVMLHIFRKMQESNANRVIAPAKLFGEDFSVNDDFYQGGRALPHGLDKLKWNILSQGIDKSKPFSGEYPRREISRERYRLTGPNESQRPATEIPVRS